jgi:hypothetical protein
MPHTAQAFLVVIFCQVITWHYKNEMSENRKKSNISPHQFETKTEK